MYQIEIKEILPNEHRLQKTNSFLQSTFWAEFKHQNGWDYKLFTVNPGNNSDTFIPFPLTVLLRKVSVFGVLAYIPLGPNIFSNHNFSDDNISDKSIYFLHELIQKLKDILPPTVFCIRCDPPWKSYIANAKGKKDQNEYFPKLPLPKKGIFKAPYDVQPPDSVHLNLTLPLETLENELKSKWRYNIKLASKKDVKITRLTGAKAKTTGLDIFYELYLDTAKRDGIAIHSKAYYKSLFTLSEQDTYNDKFEVAVYIAQHESDNLAAIIILFTDDESIYLYGASSNNKRNLMPTYAVQWQAICDAKTHGCSCYDLYGIPPIDDPKHPMYGLYRFKTGFGGEIVHYVGSLDAPIRIIRYIEYSIAEKLRSFWYKKIKKLFRH